MSKVDEWRDKTAYETSSSRTEGAESSWVMLMREGKGAASSFRASIMLMLRESDESFACDWPRNALFSQSSYCSRSIDLDVV